MSSIRYPGKMPHFGPVFSTLSVLVLGAAFFLPLPPLPDTEESRVTKTDALISGNPGIGQEPTLSAVAIGGLFVVKPFPHSPAAPAVIPPPAETAQPLPDPSLPPLPAVRYLGEAVIQNMSVYYFITGKPERVLKLPDPEEKEFNLTGADKSEFIIEYKGRIIHVPK